LLDEPEPREAHEGGDDDVEDKGEEDQSCLRDGHWQTHGEMLNFRS